MDNRIEFRVWGKFALFTDPITKIGGEKCSYLIPTYEALKGIARSVYWKPTFIWVVDRMRVMKRIRTQTKGMKPLDYSAGGNTLAFYNYLSDVEYQISAHFEWNENLPELAGDRNDGKHHSIALRTLERGGRRDIFLGTRECQGYVESCRFGEGEGELDEDGELALGLMFHSFSYPEESGADELRSRFWRPLMSGGVVNFPRPEDCEIVKHVRPMSPNRFVPHVNFSGHEEEGLLG